MLTKTIAKLRHALRDEHQQLIRTVYGQGSTRSGATTFPKAVPSLERELGAGHMWTVRAKKVQAQLLRESTQESSAVTATHP